MKKKYLPNYSKCTMTGLAVILFNIDNVRGINNHLKSTEQTQHDKYIKI